MSIVVDRQRVLRCDTPDLEGGPAFRADRPRFALLNGLFPVRLAIVLVLPLVPGYIGCEFQRGRAGPLLSVVRPATISSMCPVQYSDASLFEASFGSELCCDRTSR